MSQLPQVKQIFDAKYRIEAVLGSGGFGTVYKANQLDCNRLVALKILHNVVADENDKARFLREARTLNKLNHANIVEVYHLGVSGSGLPYMAMEFVQGQSLRSVMCEGDRLPVVRCLKLAKAIAETMAYVHQNNVVHRDLKPENVMVLQTPVPDTVKLLDFGLVKLIPDENEQKPAAEPTGGDAEATEPANNETISKQKLTSTGQMLGSITYMSPEQCLGQPIDARSDIYALTVILYEMISGRLPFEADNPVGMAYKHINETIPKISTEVVGYHPELNDLLAKGMAKDPNRRFSSMKELSAEIDFAIERCATAVKPSKRSILVPVLLTGLAGSLLAAGVLMFISSQQRKTQELLGASQIRMSPSSKALEKAALNYKQRIAELEKAYEPDSKGLAVNFKTLADAVMYVNRPDAERLYQRALVIFQKTLPPDDPLTTSTAASYARCCLDQQHFAAALGALEVALAAPKNFEHEEELAELRHGLLKAYAMTKRFDKAVPLCESLRSQPTFDPDLVAILMQGLFENGKPKEAESLFASTFGTSPDDKRMDNASLAIYQLVWHQQEINLPLVQRAVENLKASKTNDQNNATNICYFGRIFLRHKRNSEAIQLFDLASQKANQQHTNEIDWSGTYEALGLAYNDAHKFFEAEQFLKKGAKLEPAAAEFFQRGQEACVYSRLASVLDAQGKVDEADTVIKDGLASMKTDKFSNPAELQLMEGYLADREKIPRPKK